jgi:hypothetical protein
MGFKYRQYNVTLDNYRQIFSECSVDVLDEIRSAILDDTQISNFIKDCGKDSYKLGQLRMAVREFVPTEYLNSRLTARTIYYIREAYKKQLNTQSLLKYIKPKGLTLEPETLEKLAEMVYMGVDIDKVDFTKIPINLVDVFCKGLYKGYPMWLCISDNMAHTENYIKALMRGMQLGIDIHPFIDEDWSEEQLNVMFLYSGVVDINELLKYITPKFDVEIITELLKLLEGNIPIVDLVVKDTEGYPVFNKYQIIELGQAIKDKVLTKEMLNPTLSDTEIMQMRLSKTRPKKLSITLK